jgi:four helix bundle protein
MELGVLVYEVTRAMPQDERFGLTRQIRDAVASVASNIAEGHGRGTRRDYIRVLRTARGSLWEVSTELELAIRTGMLRPDPQLDDLISETGRVLQALIRALERKEREGHV